MTVLAAPSEQRVDAVRSFNRFYTNVIGLLGESMLEMPFSLTEARVLFELGRRDAMELVDLRRMLDLDAGYLSRIVARFDEDGLVKRERSKEDGRRQVVRLTGQGRRAFRQLDERSAGQVGELLSELSDTRQKQLVEAMSAIHEVLDAPAESPRFVLRAPEPGDLGWVVQRHGAVYAAEQGWDETFEALIARIVADFVEQRDPERERMWIADIGGEPAGCVFCCKREEKVAQLRLLLVDPSARGMGIGATLVDECIRFARDAGYARMMLWTQHPLTDARRIYDRAGFELVKEERHHSFGHDLIGQDLWLDL